MSLLQGTVISMSTAPCIDMALHLHWQENAAVPLSLYYTLRDF